MNTFKIAEIYYLNNNVTLKEVAEKFLLEEADIKRYARTNKWTEKKKQIDLDTPNYEGAQIAFNVLGNSLINALAVLDEMSQDYSTFQNKDEWSITKLQNFLKVHRQCVDLTERVFNYVSPTDREHLNNELLAISLRNLQGGQTVDDLDANDNFFEALGMTKQEFLEASRGGVS